MAGDVEATTSVREGSRILRYDDWVLDAEPASWGTPGGEPEDGDVLADDDDELALACRFGGHTFVLWGSRSTAELAVDIAGQVQDDVIDELWAAWPECPGHAHPMSPAVAEGAAGWTCPAANDVVLPIGKLGAPGVRRDGK